MSKKIDSKWKQLSLDRFLRGPPRPRRLLAPDEQTENHAESGRGHRAHTRHLDAGVHDVSDEQAAGIARFSHR